LSDSLLSGLQQGLRQLGEDPSNHPADSYFAYMDLLGQWNRAYNLTAITSKEKMLTHHLLDSLALLPFVQGTSCLDVGSGAGLPGLILALSRSQQQWVLLDSNMKKLRFLNQAVLELQAENVTTIQARIEDYRPDQLFSTVTSRALTSLLKFYRMAQELLQQDGVLLAMKGTRPLEELQELDAAGVVYAVHELIVPGLDGQRHVVVMRKSR